MLSPRNRRRLAKTRRVEPIAPSIPEIVLNPPRTAEQATAPSTARWFDQRSSQAHMPRSYNGPVYLYLGQPEYAQTWVAGGRIPIFAAKKYLSVDRAGIYTPDELRQRTVSLTDPRAASGLDSFFGLASGTMSFNNCTINFEGDAFPLQGTVKQDFEDAYILCFSTEQSPHLMERLRKRACVKISDPAELKNVIDREMQQVSQAGLVEYTDHPNRGHFLKSSLDNWQSEYRFVWPRGGEATIWIDIPLGTASEVDFVEG